jgi:hypothetical protein
MARSDAPEHTRHVKVRDVSWNEIVFPDDRKYLEIASSDFDDDERRLDAVCECGAALVFVRAEARMNQPARCCCGGCRRPMLLVIGTCPGCGCDNCADQTPCDRIGEEMAFTWEGDEARLFFEPVPAAERE